MHTRLKIVDIIAKIKFNFVSLDFSFKTITFNNIEIATNTEEEKKRNKYPVFPRKLIDKKIKSPAKRDSMKDNIDL